jgi:hypothetical protein
LDLFKNLTLWESILSSSQSFLILPYSSSSQMAKSQRKPAVRKGIGSATNASRKANAKRQSLPNDDTPADNVTTASKDTPTENNTPANENAANANNSQEKTDEQVEEPSKGGRKTWAKGPKLAILLKHQKVYAEDHTLYYDLVCADWVQEWGHNLCHNDEIDPAKDYTDKDLSEFTGDAYLAEVKRRRIHLRKNRDVSSPFLC